MARMPFFYTDVFQHYDMGPHHPLKPLRLKMTYALLDAYGLFDRDLEVLEPEPISREEAVRTHRPDFLDALDRLSSGEHVPGAHGYGLGTGDNPIFPGMYDSSLLYTGASACAAQAVLDGAEVGFNISGGLHHAHYARAAGFCILNDAAVAIRRLRQKFARVAYVDIDVHHGDGVQELFYDDPTVLTISLHESGRTLFPGTGDTDEVGTGAGTGFSVNLPFAPYTTDEVWLWAWREAALPLLRAFRPEAILIQMGTDTHEYDPLAHLCLSAQGWLEAVKDVREIGVPIVAVGGGGYNLTTVPRMWTLAVAALTDANISDEVPSVYASRQDIPTLTDHHIPEVEPRTIAKAQAFAEQSVEDLRRLLFPRHGLS